METVVEEKPLSLATSRMVTIEPFFLQCLRYLAPCTFSVFGIRVLEIGRLLADTNSRVKAVSSCLVRSSWILCLSLTAMFGGQGT